MCVGRPKSLGCGQKWCERKSGEAGMQVTSMPWRERVLSNKLHLFAQPSLPPSCARLKCKWVDVCQNLHLRWICSLKGSHLFNEGGLWLNLSFCSKRRSRRRRRGWARMGGWRGLRGELLDLAKGGWRSPQPTHQPSSTIIIILKHLHNSHQCKDQPRWYHRGLRTGKVRLVNLINLYLCVLHQTGCFYWFWILSFSTRLIKPLLGHMEGGLDIKCARCWMGLRYIVQYIEWFTMYCTIYWMGLQCIVHTLCWMVLRHRRWQSTSELGTALAHCPFLMMKHKIAERHKIQKIHVWTVNWTIVLDWDQIVDLDSS